MPEKKQSEHPEKKPVEKKQEHPHAEKAHAEHTHEEHAEHTHEEHAGHKHEHEETAGHVHEEKKATEKKHDAKEEKKPAEKKPEKPKKKKIFEKHVRPKKSPEIKKLRDLIKQKPRLMFRGRFGQRSWMRNIRDEKWQRWRKSRGIDIVHKKSDGLYVGIGYRNSKEIRYRHPSGFKEVLVHNLKQLEDAASDKENAVRIAGAVGRKKRNEIIRRANALKIWILNP